MIAEILLENCVILPLLHQWSKVLLHQGNKKVSVKLHRYNMVFTCAGKDKSLRFCCTEASDEQEFWFKKNNKKS